MAALSDLDTPAALIDVRQMQANIARMQARMDELGVKLRPHVKTSKSLPVVRAQLEAGARGITVSTLKEAEEFFDAGIDDIVYPVGTARTSRRGRWPCAARAATWSSSPTTSPAQRRSRSRRSCSSVGNWES